MTLLFGIMIVVAAYLVGAIPAAYLAGKWLRGVDLRRHGSGNVGATNLAALTSKTVAVPVIIFDLSKGALMVLVAHLLHMGIVTEVAVGLAAIIGHNWSVFLRFGGGRGLLTAIGVALMLPMLNGSPPWAIIITLTIVAIMVKTTRNAPLGTGTGPLVLPFLGWGLGDPLPVVLSYVTIFLISVMKRLAGPRAAIAGSLSYKQLFINRLVFDRDIRDRNAWLNRQSAGQLKTQKKD
ncbi:glycerol-3-phosphate acyltransferase [Chloroflexota bacterium]